MNKAFPLLTAHSRVVQRAAYIVLHRYIPEVQEQVSLDVALSNTSIRLPDELLSLLLESPTMESISASFGEDRMWTGLRSYLLSWKVVFDHFTNAVSLPFGFFTCYSIADIRAVGRRARKLCDKHQGKRYFESIAGFHVQFSSRNAWKDCRCFQIRRSQLRARPVRYRRERDPMASYPSVLLVLALPGQRN